MKRFFQLCLFILIAGFTSVNSQISTSKWQSQPITIDGNGAEWGTLPRFFNEESNVRYEFRNDDQNLYIILNSADRSTHMQMQVAGFSLKLKVKTTPPSKFSITFPGLNKSNMPIMKDRMDKENKLVDKSITQSEFSPKDSVVLDGFQFSTGKIQSNCENQKTICFAVNKGNREQSTYEIRIPLCEIFGDKYTMEEIIKSPIQLQVSINELSKGEMSKSRGKMSGRMNGGDRMGRGMRGGEMGEGMQGREMGEGLQGGDEMGGGEMGERPQMQLNEMNSGSSFDRKTFNIEFRLSAK